jgi:CheY-like chemotaxis protein
VEDTGKGMVEEVKEKMFEPFFSTKEEGKGTGLGLSTIYHIIQQSNGFIKVQSQISKGTTLFLYLDKMDPLDLQAQKEFEDRHEILDRRDQILLIDDDNKIRGIIKEILIMGGFEVLDASNAFDALRILNENVDNINFVISDVVMPDLSGKDLVKQILQIKPSINVLYVTGDAKEFESISNNLKENMDILLKPFNSDTLISKLQELIEK